MFILNKRFWNIKLHGVENNASEIVFAKVFSLKSHQFLSKKSQWLIVWSKTVIEHVDDRNTAEPPLKEFSIPEFYNNGHLFSIQKPRFLV